MKKSAVTRTALAKEFGVVPSTITRWERDGMPALKAGRGRETMFEVKECRAWREAQAAPASASSSRARKELAQALEAEQRIAIKAKELVRAADVEQVIAGEYARCRTKLLGLPRKAKSVLPHLSARDVQALDVLVREALEDLASA